MQFHLNYTHPKQNSAIDHSHKVLLLGSCFAENIGEKLISAKFNSLLNPNGILFNPISIVNALNSYININEAQEEDVVKSEGLFKSLNHHGSFAFNSKTELTDAVYDTNKKTNEFLKDAEYLIITFGTSKVFRFNNTNKIVANCHKLPQNNFTRVQLQPQEINESYNALIKSLKLINPLLKIIFTVSPVKYLRDGLIENNLSKSVLIYAVHELTKLHNHCTYFPAYELVNDDLRDYRFYKEDMAHPNEQAINYVWEKFSESYFSANTQQLLLKINEINLAVSHRPINTTNGLHAQFKQNYLQKCMELEKEYPFLNFTKETIHFSHL